MSEHSRPRGTDIVCLLSRSLGDYDIERVREAMQRVGLPSEANISTHEWPIRDDTGVYVNSNHTKDRYFFSVAKNPWGDEPKTVITARKEVRGTLG